MTIQVHTHQPRQVESRKIELSSSSSTESIRASSALTESKLAKNSAQGTVKKNSPLSAAAFKKLVPHRLRQHTSQKALSTQAKAMTTERTRFQPGAVNVANTSEDLTFCSDSSYLSDSESSTFPERGLGSKQKAVKHAILQGNEETGLPQKGEIGKLFAKSDRISLGTGNLREAFTPKFQEKQAWLDALGSVKEIQSGSEPLSLSDFQNLFVAAWTTNPTEKGAYIIELKDDSLKGRVKEGMECNLSSRVSSHLKGPLKASASKGFHFLENYHELLVQLEEHDGKTLLFLKGEGHSINGIKNTALHGVSWVNKIITGKGVTNSPELKQSGEVGQGVYGRAAENYSKPWGRLIKELGLTGTNGSGKTVTVNQVVSEEVLRNNLNNFSLMLTCKYGRKWIDRALECAV